MYSRASSSVRNTIGDDISGFITIQPCMRCAVFVILMIVTATDASDEWSRSIRQIKKEADLAGPDKIPPYPDVTAERIKELELLAEAAAHDRNDCLMFDVTSLCAGMVRLWEQEHGEKTNPDARREEATTKFIEKWNEIHPTIPIDKVPDVTVGIDRRRIAGKGQYEICWSRLDSKPMGFYAHNPKQV